MAFKPSVGLKEEYHENLMFEIKRKIWAKMPPAEYRIDIAAPNANRS